MVWQGSGKGGPTKKWHVADCWKRKREKEKGSQTIQWDYGMSHPNSNVILIFHYKKKIIKIEKKKVISPKIPFPLRSFLVQFPSFSLSI